ncbi:MAG TPA: hypothetical protein VMH85_21695 [Terriglobales bacterium]|nr:hypothetical protein [Terriglobales bacterium]
MGLWASGAFYRLLLIGLLVLIATVQVLPQVDLPATVLSGESAATALHAINAPALFISPWNRPFAAAAPVPEKVLLLGSSTPSESSFLPILHRSIRC